VCQMTYGISHLWLPRIIHSSPFQDPS